jgi:inner membrane protein
MSDPARFNPLIVKLILVAIITLLLLWPLNLVQALIGERSAVRAAAVERVAGNVGHAQQIGAVMLIVPVTRSWSADGKTYSKTAEYRLLAQTVQVEGSVVAAARHSGIYSVPTFQAKLQVSGSLTSAELRGVTAPESGIVKRIGQVALFVAIADPAGIRTLAGIRVDGKMLPVTPVRVGDLPGEIEFAFDLQISGTERLQFLPLAESTQVDLRSSWPSPSFSGAFGPLGSPRISSEGFTAQWRVLQLNRGYPQQWVDDKVSQTQIAESAFGVDFYEPVDTYQCNYRANHYAFLFIAVSFMVLFLLEQLLALPLHPVQYAMTGAALSIFYLVLLAVSEHLSFGVAYTFATAALVLLLSIYYGGVLGRARGGAIAGLVSGVGYALLYLLILSEDYALLCGALALFAVLAAIMIATRKVDWSRLGRAA